MSVNQSTLEIAADIESRAYTLAKRGDEQFVMAAALFISVLRNAEFDDVEAMADGDEDALGAFVDRRELGTFVHEHILDIFQEIARMELDERNENAKSAWDVEMELRQLQGGMA